MKLIESLGLKKNAIAVFRKALDNRVIDIDELRAIYPLAMWCDKKKIDTISLTLYSELNTRGVSIIDSERNIKKPFNFSFVDYFPFNLISPDEMQKSSLLMNPLQKKFNEFVAMDDGEKNIFLIASGGIALQSINMDGNIKIARFYSAGDFFRLTLGLCAIVASQNACFWLISKDAFAQFPPSTQKILENLLKKEEDALKWILAKLDPDSNKRILLACQYLDEKYDCHIPFTTDYERGLISNLTREHVTRVKKGIAPSKR